MSRRPIGRRATRRGVGGPGPRRAGLSIAVSVVVSVWIVAPLFTPAADRAAGDLAQGAGTVAARVVTGFADVLTGWLTEVVVPSLSDGTAPAGEPGDKDGSDLHRVDAGLQTQTRE